MKASLSTHKHLTYVGAALEDISLRPVQWFLLASLIGLISSSNALPPGNASSLLHYRGLAAVDFTRTADNFEKQYCDSDVDCTAVEDTFCIDSTCECQVNNRLILEPNSNITICAPFKCAHNSDCQEWDSNMVCTTEQTCVCRRDFFASDRKCTPMSGGVYWVLYLCIIPILLVVFFCVYICIRLGRHSKATLRQRATDFRRRMSRKFSVITGVGLSSGNASGTNHHNNNNHNNKDAESNKVARSVSQTEI